MSVKIEYFKETVFEENKNFFEISKAEKVVEDMICNFGEPKTDEDSKKITWLHTELERLEKLEEEALEWSANQIAEKVIEKEEKFMNTDFGENSEPYKLLKWLEHCADNDKNTYLNTDGFGYDEHWKEEIPDWYLKETNGDEHKALEKYYDVMHELEELFSHLCYFTEDISDHFPEQRLIIRLGKYRYDFDYIVGQGSDFSISVVEKCKPELYEKNPIKFVLDYNTIVELSKLSACKQAEYYAEHMLRGKVTPENYGKIMFLLGQATAKVGFPNYLNKDNFDEKIRLCD